MKKIVALLVCLILILCPAGVFAQEMPGFPFDIPGDSRSNPYASSVSEAIRINILGQSLTLDFDPAADFSYAKNGVVQASFYAYSADGVYLYELYMTFPDTVTSGAVVTPQDALMAGLDECCIVTLISTQTTEDYYIAAQYGDGGYPEGTDYSIRFDSVLDTAGGRMYTGVLSATMAGEDITGAPIAQNLTITDAAFSFTLPSGGDSQQPYYGATPAPAATPTVRPDLFRI